MRTTSNQYFEWLCNFVYDSRNSKRNSYTNLLMHLFRTEYTWQIELDSNRAADGFNLRNVFAMEYKVYPIDLPKECSVLEMLIALSNRLEHQIMSDPEQGDRTGQWFWDMIVNMQLGSMDNANYNAYYVDKRLSILLNREFDQNGSGGLFTLKNPREDLTQVQFWTIANWYLSEQAGFLDS